MGKNKRKSDVFKNDKKAQVEEIEQIEPVVQKIKQKTPKKAVEQIKQASPQKASPQKKQQKQVEKTQNVVEEEKTSKVQQSKQDLLLILHEKKLAKERIEKFLGLSDDFAVDIESGRCTILFESLEKFEKAKEAMKLLKPFQGPTVCKMVPGENCVTKRFIHLMTRKSGEWIQTYLNAKSAHPIKGDHTGTKYIANFLTAEEADEADEKHLKGVSVLPMLQRIHVPSDKEPKAKKAKTEEVEDVEGEEEEEDDEEGEGEEEEDEDEGEEEEDDDEEGEGEEEDDDDSEEEDDDDDEE